jgi:membrane peptidoglycan carboxypeptidase
MKAGRRPRGRRTGGRYAAFAFGVFLTAISVALLARELKEGRLQARFFAWVAAEVHHQVAAGPNPDLDFPQAGPFDARMGYSALPAYLERLAPAGWKVQAQARWSARMDALQSVGLFPAYREKSKTGLRVLDRGGRLLFDAVDHRVYPDFESIPPVVATSLTWLENRELLDESVPHRNPAIEWGRLALAVSRAGTKLVVPETRVPGASTLATQLEKFRHSPGGRTTDAEEKLRQMASAAVRAYLDGSDTVLARRLIFL